MRIANKKIKIKIKNKNNNKNNNMRIANTKIKNNKK